MGVDIVDLKSTLNYGVHDTETPLTPAYFKYTADEGKYGALVNNDKYIFTENGFETLCKFIEGQKKFLLSLTDEMRTKVINEKLSETVDKTVTIRCIKEDNEYYIRSIIARDWVQFDNVDVVSTMEPILKQYGMCVESADFDNYKMDLRIVFDSDMGPDDDKMNIGLSVINDECTSKPLTIDLLMFRQICSNGLIVRHNMSNIGSIPHSRITSENFASRLSMILTAMQPRVQFLVNSFHNMKDKTIDLNTLDNMASKWQKYYRIPKKMLVDAVKGIPPTYYDLVNGITESARDSENMNARRRGEISAGHMLLDVFSEANSSNKQWDEVFVKQSRGRPRKH